MSGKRNYEFFTYKHVGCVEQVDDGFQAVCKCRLTKRDTKEWRSKVVDYRTEAMKLLCQHYGLNIVEKEEWEV